MYEGKTVLTGIKPTGTPHLGNLIGAIKPTIHLSRQTKRSFVFVADLHALNSVRDSAALNNHTREIAATFMALGLDINKTLLFRQSDVSEIFAMASLLTNVTPKSLMNRGHAYKAAVEANSERREMENDTGINMGLYTYPILMAADILLYGADIVPVGHDQRQHVEFARDIAGYFNNLYRENVLAMPEPLPQETPLLVGLDGKKMSKSYNNTIPIFAEPRQLRILVNRIKTDAKLPREPKDPNHAIIQIYEHFAQPDQVSTLRENFSEGRIGYGDAKVLLFHAINNRLEGPRQIYKDFMAKPEALTEILEACADAARQAAQHVYTFVFETMLGRKPQGPIRVLR